MSAKRQELIAGNREVIARGEESLRRYVTETPTWSRSPGVALAAQYHVMDDGSAHHAQASGWRMIPDVIVEKLLDSAEQPYDEDSSRRDIQVKYRELEKRQLAYPFLAAWRLCIEVELKSTIEGVVQILPGGALAGRLKKEMARHDVAYLWDFLTRRLLPDLRVELGNLQPRLGVPADSPGFACRVEAEHQDVIAELVAIDPDGQTLRYASALDGTPNLSRTPAINIGEMHRRLSDTYGWLGRISGVSTSIRVIRESEDDLKRLSALVPIEGTAETA